MKFNLILAAVGGLLGAVAGITHDLTDYRDALNTAKQKNQPAPPYDFALTLGHAVKGFTVGASAALGITQVPGVPQT